MPHVPVTNFDVPLTTSHAARVAKHATTVDPPGGLPGVVVQLDPVPPMPRGDEVPARVIAVHRGSPTA